MCFHVVLQNPTGVCRLNTDCLERNREACGALDESGEGLLNSCSRKLKIVMIDNEKGNWLHLKTIRRENTYTKSDEKLYAKHSLL